MDRRRFLAVSAATAASLALGKEQHDLAHDPLRPQFHLLPRGNWMNDPNGPIYWNGLYHMFYQLNPGAAVWGDMHWGHAVSPDMIHWRHQPIALAPTPGGPDQDGVFSGCCVDDHGVCTAIYTGVRTVPERDATLIDGQHTFRETQLIATSTDPDLRTWKKVAEPVIASPPPGMKVLGFRDPAVWRDAGAWYMAIGSGTLETGGLVLLYRSLDLRKWEYLHPLTHGTPSGKRSTNPVDTGDMWECPDFFALDGFHVLLYSTKGRVFWKTGHLDPKALTFHEVRRGNLDMSKKYYAARTQLDANGNRILWGWITETRSEAEMKRAGWSGMMSLPRKLNVTNDGTLLQSFAPQTTSLRANKVQDPKRIPHCAGEFVVHIPKQKYGKFSWSADSDGVVLRFTGPSEQQYRPADPTTRETSVEVRGFIDGSVLELIADRYTAITDRFYPVRTTIPDFARTRVLPDFRIEVPDGATVEAYQLTPISSNRLIT